MNRRARLDDLVFRKSILARISTLKPDAPRLWGKMSAHQMLCHLTDSYRAVIGEKQVSSKRLPIPRPLLRWLILNAPWPKNARTRPEVDQLIKGTTPTDFDTDRATLIAAIDRFCATPDSKRTPHPLIGNLDHEDWMRWGYLHADHHLRQFGL